LDGVEMKSITSTIGSVIAAIASTAFGHKKNPMIFHSDKHAIKNKIEFHRKRDRRK